MARRQHHKSHPSDSLSDEDDDRPRSILKPAPSSDVAVKSSKPTFAQGLKDSSICSYDGVVTAGVLSLSESRFK